MAPNTKGFYLPWSQERTVAIVERHRAKLGALMPILHELQDVFGHIDARAVDLVAEALDPLTAESYGAVALYKDVRPEVPGASVIHVGRGKDCQSMGAERLPRRARE